MEVSIRGIDKDTFSIFIFSGGQRKSIEKNLEKAMAYREGFEGAIYPLRLLTDRNDVGGVSTPNHNDLKEKAGIFIYDGHQGGVGYGKE